MIEKSGIVVEISISEYLFIKKLQNYKYQKPINSESMNFDVFGVSIYLDKSELEGLWSLCNKKV